MFGKPQNQLKSSNCANCNCQQQQIEKCENSRNEEDKTEAPPQPQNSSELKNDDEETTTTDNDLQQLLNCCSSTSDLKKNVCIIERLRTLYLSESMADVHFSLSNERLPAHKLILSLGSPVFSAMFFGSGRDLLASADEVQLPDVRQPQAFKCMLRYLYTDELAALGSDWVMDALYVAKKYAITALERHCVDFLTRNICCENVLMLLEHARLFDEASLTDACFDWLDGHASEALGSEHFCDEVDLPTLETLVRRSTLGIREYKLYAFLVKWATRQCQKRQLEASRENLQSVLGNTLQQIRFTLMSVEELALAMSDAQNRLIDNSVIIDLFCRLTLSSNSNNQISSSGAATIAASKVFNIEKPRYCPGGDGLQHETINRFDQVESRWGYSGTPDRIKLSVNRRIFVVGFGLYGSIYGRCEYHALIKLSRCTQNTLLCAENALTFTCDGSNGTWRALFKEPVEVLPDVEYIASVTLTGPDSYYGAKGRRVLTHESSHGNGKVTFHFQYACGNNNGTSIEDGQIPEIIFLYSC